LSTVLGSEFEQGVITAAGLGAVNVEPGSLRIKELGTPDVMVRFTLVATVPRTVIDGLAVGLFTPAPPVQGEGAPSEGEPNVVEGV
jgi:hypothetical protein